MRLLAFFILLKTFAILACYFFMLPVMPFITIPNSTLNVASQSVITKTGAAYTCTPLMFYKSSNSSGISNPDSNLQSIDGDLIVIADHHVDMVAHYYHIMEHLLGIWNFLLYKDRENVKMILLSFQQKRETDNTWPGLNNVTYLLLTKIFPNAKINLINDLPPDINIQATNIHISNRYRVLGATNMNGPLSRYYKPQRIRELRDLIYEHVGVVAVPPADHLRITYVKRTGNKRVMDSKLEQQLLDAITKETSLAVRVVDFSQMSFQEQLQTVANTDLLIGVHGNGLTHIIFLPDNATVIEYHPGEKCAYFRTLAQIRDVQYYGNYHMNWYLKYNRSLQNSWQDIDVTELDVNGTVMRVKTLNNWPGRLKPQLAF